jgi:hypothetical protein
LAFRVDELVSRHRSRELDEGDPAVRELAGLLRFGQHGYQNAA